MLKIYSPVFAHGQKYYYFEKSENMSNRNIDSDSDEETLVTQHLKVKLLKVDTGTKQLVEVLAPTVPEIRKMEQIIDNLYKRIPLYLEVQKDKKLKFSKLIDNHFETRLHFLTSREVVDFEGQGLQYVDKIKTNIVKGKQKLFSEQQIWHFLKQMMDMLNTFHKKGVVCNHQ